VVLVGGGGGGGDMTILLGANKQVALETTIIRISDDQNSELNHKCKTLENVARCSSGKPY